GVLGEGRRRREQEQGGEPSTHASSLCHRDGAGQHGEGRAEPSARGSRRVPRCDLRRGLLTLVAGARSIRRLRALMTDQALLDALNARSGGQCELCESRAGLRPHAVSPGDDTADRSVLLCEECAARLEADELDPKHWFCLKESIWSGVPAVQVLSFRLLHRLRAEGWAAEALDQAYLADEVREWAMEGLPSDSADDEGATKTV